MRSQFVISSYGGRRYMPYVFTEQGVAMLSSVLNSKKAVQINVQIIRAFVRLRIMLSNHDALRLAIQGLERRVARNERDIQLIPLLNHHIDNTLLPLKIVSMIFDYFLDSTSLQKHPQKVSYIAGFILGDLQKF